MTCEYVRGTDIKITERRLSVEDTLSRRATREVTQGLNLAHRHFFLIPPLFRGRSRLENDRLIGSFQPFQACSISRAEHSVYTRASESLIAMQLELSYWKDKPCLSLSLPRKEWNKRNVETNSNRERVVRQPHFYPRFFKRLDNTNFCNLGGIAAAWQFRMNPLSGRLRARVDLRGKFYKADPPLRPFPPLPSSSLPSPPRPGRCTHGSNRIDAG